MFRGIHEPKIGGSEKYQAPRHPAPSVHSIYMVTANSKAPSLSRSPPKSSNYIVGASKPIIELHLADEQAVTEIGLQDAWPTPSKPSIWGLLTKRNEPCYPQELGDNLRMTVTLVSKY